MKQLLNFLGVVLFLLVIGSHTFAQDFIGKSPTTKPFKDLCYPIQTGKSVKVPITALCNMTKIYQSYTVSIDTGE